VRRARPHSNSTSPSRNATNEEWKVRSSSPSVFEVHHGADPPVHLQRKCRRVWRPFRTARERRARLQWGSALSLTGGRSVWRDRNIKLGPSFRIRNAETSARPGRGIADEEQRSRGGPFHRARGGQHREPARFGRDPLGSRRALQALRPRGRGAAAPRSSSPSRPAAARASGPTRAKGWSALRGPSCARDRAASWPGSGTSTIDRQPR
jgi:hypothetical protein